jgi:hypothetical protein
MHTANYRRLHSKNACYYFVQRIWFRCLRLNHAILIFLPVVWHELYIDAHNRRYEDSSLASNSVPPFWFTSCKTTTGIQITRRVHSTPKHESWHKHIPWGEDSFLLPFTWVYRYYHFFYRWFTYNGDDVFRTQCTSFSLSFQLPHKSTW